MLTGSTRALLPVPSPYLKTGPEFHFPPQNVRIVLAEKSAESRASIDLFQHHALRDSSPFPPDKIGRPPLF